MPKYSPCSSVRSISSSNCRVSSSILRSASVFPVGRGVTLNGNNDLAGIAFAANENNPSNHALQEKTVFLGKKCVTYVWLSYCCSIVMKRPMMLAHYPLPNRWSPMNSNVRVVMFANFCWSISSRQSHWAALAPVLPHLHLNWSLMVPGLMRPISRRLAVRNVSYTHNPTHSNRPCSVGSLTHLVYSNSVTASAPYSIKTKKIEGEK